MLDQQAIMRAYPDVVSITEDKAFALDEAGAYEGAIKDITATLDQSKIDAARAEIDALNYQKSRTGEDGTTDTTYPELGEQFDLLFKDIQNGTLTTSGGFFTAIKAVKDKYPKPS